MIGLKSNLISKDSPFSKDLKSDYDRIEMSGRAHTSVAGIVLKSDYDRIEIQRSHISQTLPFPLKSDYDRIEMDLSPNQWGCTKT